MLSINREMNEPLSLEAQHALGATRHERASLVSCVDQPLKRRRWMPFNRRVGIR